MWRRACGLVCLSAAACANHPPPAEAPRVVELNAPQETREKGEAAPELPPQPSVHAGRGAWELEDCPQAGATVRDLDGDGEPDSWMVTRDGKLFCRAFAFAGHGRPNATEFYDAEGNPRMRCNDFDLDGQPDEIVRYGAGGAVISERDTDGDGRPDTRETSDDSGCTLETDEDHDGMMDKRTPCP